MKNKKGFTLVELLAVIVLLGILISIAVVGVSRYRRVVDEKEKLSLKQTIKASFNNYRIKENVDEKMAINVSELIFEGGLKYSGAKCNVSDGMVLYVVNGNYFSKFKDNESDMIKYKVCEFKISENDDENNIVCLRDEVNNIVPSNMETVCVKLSCDGNVVINDFEDSNSLCYKDITGIS